MLETSRVWGTTSRVIQGAAFILALALAGCAGVEPDQGGQSVGAAAVSVPAQKAAPVDPQVRLEEARALLAQAETDIQRARARRALWSKAWEALVSSRASLARSDSEGAIRLAKRASELAQLGLEQLAYPAVKLQTTTVE